MERLKSCPFCGSDNVMALYCSEIGTEYAYEGHDVDGDVNPYIHCYGCDSEWFSSESGVDVIKAWNRRANDDTRTMEKGE